MTQEAKAAAMEKWSPGVEIVGEVGDAFYDGFDAGAAFERERAGAEHQREAAESAAWVPIRSEADLPKEGGPYLASRNPAKFYPEDLYALEWFSTESETIKRKWLRQFVAWMPLPPPYAADSREGGEG